MANQCETTITMLGTQTGVTQVFNFLLSCVVAPPESAGTAPEAGIDFNLILPMPADLEPKKDGNEFGKGEKAALIAEYGVWDWYEWRTANWGVRGNFPVIFQQEDPSDSDYGLGCEASIRFNTASLPPSGIIEALSKRFPDVGFLCVYDEPHSQMNGAFAMLAGQFVGRESVRRDEFPEEEADTLDEAVSARLVEIEIALADSLTELLEARRSSKEEVELTISE